MKEIHADLLRKHLQRLEHTEEARLTSGNDVDLQVEEEENVVYAEGMIQFSAFEAFYADFMNLFTLLDFMILCIL